jgi:ABC-2 type transport system ATP-binding protein
LGKRYGSFAALDDCSLQIRQGEIFGLLGPNGAGKTTLLRCLLGFLRPTSGWATLGGYDCWAQRTLAHQQLSYMPAQPQLPRLLRARDVLRFFAEIRPLPAPVVGASTSAAGAARRAAAQRYERACQLADRLQLDLHRWVAFMSTGMRQKLAIAATLCADVPIVFLDEPTANLDPDVRSQLLQELAQLRSQGTTVVFSSHVLSEIEQVCDRVAVLAKGRLVGLSQLAHLRQGSVITGRFADPPPRPAWDPTWDVSWEVGAGHEFKWRTYRRLETILPDLLAAGVRELQIQTLGLLDVYHQHLAYSPPGTAAGLLPPTESLGAAAGVSAAEIRSPE